MARSTRKIRNSLELLFFFRNNTKMKFFLKLCHFDNQFLNYLKQIIKWVIFVALLCKEYLHSKMYCLHY